MAKFIQQLQHLCKFNGNAIYRHTERDRDRQREKGRIVCAYAYREITNELNSIKHKSVATSIVDNSNHMWRQIRIANHATNELRTLDRRFFFFFWYIVSVGRVDHELLFKNYHLMRPKTDYSLVYGNQIWKFHLLLIAICAIFSLSQCVQFFRPFFSLYIHWFVHISFHGQSALCFFFGFVHGCLCLCGK